MLADRCPLLDIKGRDETDGGLAGYRIPNIQPAMRADNAKTAG